MLSRYCSPLLPKPRAGGRFPGSSPCPHPRLALMRRSDRTSGQWRWHSTGYSLLPEACCRVDMQRLSEDGNNCAWGSSGHRKSAHPTSPPLLLHPQHLAQPPQVPIDDDRPVVVERRRGLVAVRPSLHPPRRLAVLRDVHLDVGDVVVPEPIARNPAVRASGRAVKDQAGLGRGLRRRRGLADLLLRLPGCRGLRLQLRQLAE